MKSTRLSCIRTDMTRIHAFRTIVVVPHLHIHWLAGSSARSQGHSADRVLMISKAFVSSQILHETSTHLDTSTRRLASSCMTRPTDSAAHSLVGGRGSPMAAWRSALTSPAHPDRPSATVPRHSVELRTSHYAIDNFTFTQSYKQF